MKRLSGWDAVLLYSETPNVHMHTLKVAVIELDSDRRDFDIDAFRRVIHSRLYKLEPFCYQLVDIPLKLHHPMWRENCDVDLTYHVRPWRLRAPGGRRELDEAIGEIASTPLDRDHPLWEMYFIEGLADNRIAVVGKVHHALADGVAAANLLARGMDLAPGPQNGEGRYAPDPAPSTGELVRSAFADHMRHIGRIPGTIGYTAKGINRVRRSSRKLSPELTMPFTPPPTFMNHMLTPERRFATATLALSDVKETGKALGVTINDMVLALSAGALRKLRVRYDGDVRPPAAGVRAGELRLLAGPGLGEPVHRNDGGAARRHRRSVGAGEARARLRGRRQGEPSPARPGTGQPVGGLLSAGALGVAVPLAGQPRRPEQGAQPADLQRPGSA